MSSTVSLGRQWPPSPSVEDESESLSRELLDPSVLDIMSNDTCVISRGSVDQYPIILPSDTLTPCTTPTDACGSPIGSNSGNESPIGNTGVITPPFAPSPSSDLARQHGTGTSALFCSQHGTYEPCNVPSEISPRSGGNASSSRAPQVHQPYRCTVNEAEYSVQQKPGLSRHFSEGNEKPSIHEVAGRQAEWHSDNEALISYRGPDALETPSIVPIKKKKKVNFQLPDEPATERLPWERSALVSEHEFDPPFRPDEEEYSSRHSNQYYEDETPMDIYHPAFVKYRQDYTCLAHPQPLKINCNYGEPRSRVSGSKSPVTSPLKLTSRSPAHSPQRRTPSPTGYRLSPITRTALDVTKTILPNSNRDCRASTNSSPIRRRGPFLSPPLLPSGYEVIVRKASDKQSHRLSVPLTPSPHLLSRSRSSMIPSQVVVRRQQPVTTPPPSISLAPCPRSIPMAGHLDWYTIKGLTHLDICPSCMNQIGNSRFRDLFIPSLPKSRDANVRCSFSQPWARLAWVQTMKLKLNHLELLYHITRPHPGSRPCTGRLPSVQPWYRLSDPETGRAVSDFNACSACFRNLQILMPSLRDAFRSGPLVQERICDLRVDSSRFVRYLDLLDDAASRCQTTSRGQLDMREFVRYARRKSIIRNCQRDHFAEGPWHYIPELPELTICEDCYDDVVHDLSHTGIGKMVLRTPQMVPGRRDQPYTCQLYSPRMRTVFRAAVQHGDFDLLATSAQRRHEAENSFRERKMRLLDDVAKGYDKDAELRWNADDWRRCE
ncbi:uncharacterized protein PADG_05521 [Paracoccidioides brasiliensis Pb18]|uniref:Uncharacterized protein n=1 Tax=Paracoccidioides brasiliensis (strain Pb18) TaxID=502780 RepID=C1GE35_PARBD|nr:uncharacterized protein PADG_05521 [Paracoccidioides brasiliensis Pb18]EEH49442.2 hypothetical protein PADG_05521 [Paracoccidioides brasiliensis Pb18]